MPLRCLLFCSDQEATDLMVRVLAELSIDAEHCPNAIMATERVTSQPFQFVILDWDDQPDAGLLLSAARTRKAAERPLTLAMVGADAGVPKALQAGANSILRKPLLVNQVRDTLTTARDLLRAKLEQSASTAKAMVAKASASPAPAVELPSPASAPASLRAGEFLQSSAPQPGAQFITDSDMEKGVMLEPTPAVIDPLQELEPMAAALGPKDKTPAAGIPATGQPRGLAWYKARNAATASGAAAAAAPALAPLPAGGFASALPPAPGKPELLGYEQTPSSAAAFSEKATPAASSTPVVVRPDSDGIEPFAVESSSSPAVARERSDQKNESELFAYMAGEAEKQPSSSTEPSTSRLRPALIAVCAIAVCTGIAYLTVPQKLWKPGLQRQSTRIASAVHGWLNPQPVAPAQAPSTHESFARAGDEYKMPVAEAIPDATTDPAQIRVVPVIDPTAKQPHTGSANTSQATDSQSPNVSDHTPTATPDGPASTANPNAAIPIPSEPQPAPQTQAPQMATATSAPPKPSVVPPVTQPSRQPQFTAVSVGIPSSLKSQMASSTSDPGGNKSPDAAMPSIEPVAISEAAARNLLAQQPVPAYPESAKGQSGTVILQVLIARDGSVQDAKFMQGSLVFARAATDAVKQWHFQPYTMNGRPVSTVTSLTINFKPAS
jgi:protein TonB